MTKKDQKVLATILLIVGGYLIYRKMPKSKASIPTSETKTNTGIGSGTGSGSGTKPFDNVFEYVVNTTSGTLNVRPTPATNLAPIAKYAKGKVFYGRPSTIASTWVEVLDVSGSFPKVIGYVSSQFVLKK